MKRPMAWVGLSFFSALILFCIYGLWAAIAGGLVSLCLLSVSYTHLDVYKRQI